MSKTKVKICSKCTGVKKKDLKEAGVFKDDVSLGCMGGCVKKHPELAGKAYAKIDGKLVVCESKKKLMKKVREAVA